MIDILDRKSKSIIEASSEHTHASSAKQKFLGFSRYGTAKNISLDRDGSPMNSSNRPGPPLKQSSTWNSNNFGYQEENDQTAQAARETF